MMSSKIPKQCPICGAVAAQERSSPRVVRVGTEEYRIEDDLAMHCGACGELYYTPGQARASSRKLTALKAIRKDRLRPEQIKSIRGAAGLSQRRLEELLGVGPKTFTRWESGDTLPNAATDRLLRLLYLVPQWVEIAGEPFERLGYLRQRPTETSSRDYLVAGVSPVNPTPVQNKDTRSSPSLAIGV